MPNSIIKISYKKHILSPPLLSSDDCYKYFLKVWDKGTIQLQESYYILCVDSDGCVICWRCINIGCSDHVTIDIKTTLCCAIGSGASKLIVAHNHPSGNLEPSHLDLVFTKRLKAIADVADIILIDHLILSRVGYYSFFNVGVI